MRHNLLTKALIAAVLLILTVPLGASAQVYNRARSNNRYNNRDQSDRVNRRDVRDAINRLDSSSARLENDLNRMPGRRVLGVLELRTTDNTAVTQVHDFRLAVGQLRNNSNDGRALNRGVDEAQRVLDRGVQLDRYLRLRTGSTTVDLDLSELRSNLHTLADAYGLGMPY